MTLVMKFGGTSVGDSTAIQQVASLVRESLDRAPLVVLSAMARVTNALFDAGLAAKSGGVERALSRKDEIQRWHLAAANELFAGAVPDPLRARFAELFDELDVLLRGVAMLRELTPRSMDAIAATGERLSSRLVTAYLTAADVPCEWFDARSVMRTDPRFGSARPRRDRIRELCREHLTPRLVPGRAIVTQGYIGATDDELTTTLGRGGSDYSAALFGAALGAEEVQIWTDVEGVMTCDPRVVKEARPIAEISFDEAAELSAFGAKVLHPATIQPAVEANIPVTVRHAGRPDGAFTRIVADVPTKRAVTALAARGPITVLTVTSTRMLAQSGYLARLFEVFARHDVSVDIVATAEVSVSLTVESDAPLDALVSELSSIAKVELAQDRAIVAVVGERLKQTNGVAAMVFEVLRDVNVEMISMGANEINLSLVVRQDDVAVALRRLHRGLIEQPAPAGASS